MRIIVMFDLPVVTKRDRVNYFNFRKHLLLQGFIMIQESIYCKLALNNTVAETIKKFVRDVKPPKGLVQMLTITEKQFGQMEFVVGVLKTDVINSTDRYIEL